jgi:hypothetical protein
MARKIIYQTGLVALVLLISACKYNRPEPEIDLRVGDLLFQDIDCGPICEAIETVTKGYNNSDFSHIGMLDTNNGEWVVLEAVSAGVIYTPLNDFLNRSADTAGNPKVIVGRVKEQFQPSIGEMMRYARSKLGFKYDTVYTLEDSVYYCSELVFEAYTHESHHLFTIAPMTFKAEGSDEFFPSWIEYYKSMQTDIPEGELGINPGLISRSDNIEIVHVYGYPEGYELNSGN